MKLHRAEKTECRQRSLLRAKDASQLRKRAEMSGIPVFALRMAASHKMRLAEIDTTVRRRHD